MTNPHTPRPSDLVALVSFDGDVVPNQAVTRDRLGRTAPAPHALGAAIEQWLGRRPVWIDVRGRQIRGIATAREMHGRDAWQIDTLVDATGGTSGKVVAGLLRQATEAATEARVGRLLLRLEADSSAVLEARRAGFTVALEEQLWTRTHRGSEVDSTSSVQVRDSDAADAFFEFQLYCRTFPVEARQALGMTFDEWGAAQERRWARGMRQQIAVEQGQARAALRATGSQLTVIAEADAHDCAEALLRAAEVHLDTRVLALQPMCDATPARALRDHGFEPGPTYVLLAQRTMRTVRAMAREAIRTRTVVPSGG